MKNRPGVSLTELIIALSLFSILLVVSLGFYRQQGQAFTSGNQRMTVMQNLRYGVNALEQNLRTAGIGVPAKQPLVVYASDRVFAFNADYASSLSDDVFAVYRDPGLPATATSVLPRARRFTLPGTTFTYPDSTYYDGAGNSPAETITFFFAQDNSTTRLDDHVLYRQVNDGPAEVIARGLLQAGSPFLTYYVLFENAAGSPVAQAPAAYLPAAHTEAIHGSPADTGIIAAADSIRAVRVTYAATNGLEGDKETVRRITRLIRLPNAGIATQRSCGNKPILGTTLAATGVSPAGTTAGHILLSWGQATDETTGEQDVMRYVIWRRTGSTGWGDPLVSVAPGGGSYTHQDFTAAPGTYYEYALAAQDCTPQYSPLSTSGSVQWTP